MLDSFEILTTSGVVVWSRSFSQINPAIINNFIADTFIEEKGGFSAVADSKSAASNPPYKSEQHTLKWTLVKELGVIFVAVYRSLLHLSWVDKFVDNIRTIFVRLYGEQLTKPHTTLVECHAFDEYFDQQLQELDTTSAKGSVLVAQIGSIVEDKTAYNSINDAPSIPEEPTSPELTPAVSPNVSRPATPGNNHLLVAKAGPVAKMSRRARKAKNTSPSSYMSSGDESSSLKRGKKPGKKGRKWGPDGLADEEDDVQLDYSQASPGSKDERQFSNNYDTSELGDMGARTGGKFILKDLGDEVHEILASEAEKNAGSRSQAKTGLLGTGVNAISGLFRNVVGGKTLTKADLDNAMRGMEEHLLKKNVAREAAVRLCEGVEKELLGVKTGNFESINTKIQAAMEASLTKMLTPTSSLDLLREIDAITAPSVTSLRKARPYVISIVGVNGVGKSTNLSKICFFLLQNKYKVLIAAGDTFRSGAVEQLAVHVRNLKELTAREGGQVELYQKGYGKDAANVAKDAVAHAAQEGFDVVLIDTAGRRHNDQRLMSSLEKFAKFAQPDKILMVGEALVGTDSVAQARNFNAAFGATRSLDGFIISKCDTVGDMVGTLVSLVHATNVPVLFVGVGQHYSDLRNFSVRWAVEKLLSANN
ncbi:signal recognition particle, alpha subunit, N-terminal-domain-containing protein [Thelonectria olida]|uniref:Signal recognition particle receptor subunit alpha homolog n=1 Tax=Thelonectria olida TaxID=1576542 RepID=A0A9P9APU6_9HYPO|nr:signal recognition particle, alpha subunit, N-terminal-domain-containing protein [Thelonectria olida]